MKDDLPKRTFEIFDKESLSKLASTIIYPIRNKSWRWLWKAYLSTWSISTSQLKEIAADDGRIWIDDNPEPFIYHYPKDVDNHPEPEDHQQKEKLFDFSPTRYSPEQRFVCEIPDCQLVGPMAAPFIGGRKLILEPFGGEPKYFLGIKRLIHRKEILVNVSYQDHRRNGIRPWDAIARGLLLPKLERNTHVPRLAANHVFPMVHISASYSHWIVDHLPKLRMLDVYEKQTGNKPSILTRSDPASYEIETLSLLGYGENRISEWSGGEYKVDHLVTTNHRIGRHSIRDYKWLRKQFLSEVDTAQQEKTAQKVYISRQQARNRMVRNYREWEEELESRGFEPIIAESLSVKDQIRVFNNADVIMGPHGAGLTNMVFGDDPLVIELFPDSRIQYSFMYMADRLGFEYEPLITDSIGNNDLVVNVDDLSEQLDEIGV